MSGLRWPVLARSTGSKGCSDPITTCRSSAWPAARWTPGRRWAGLAALTKRIRLGTMVSPATFRHPSVLAKTVATVDHISGGSRRARPRRRLERARASRLRPRLPPLAERMSLFAEQIELVHRQWTEDEVNFDGRHYRTDRLRALPRPVQNPRPRLIVGGSARRGTVHAGRPLRRRVQHDLRLPPRRPRTYQPAGRSLPEDRSGPGDADALADDRLRARPRRDGATRARRKGDRENGTEGRAGRVRARAR